MARHTGGLGLRVADWRGGAVPPSAVIIEGSASPRCTRVLGHSHPGRVSADSLSQARHLGCCLAAQGDLAVCQARDAAMRANHCLPGPDGQQGPTGAA